jgi:hypothetical protein
MQQMMLRAHSTEERFLQLQEHVKHNFTHANTAIANMCEELAKSFTTI